MNIEDYREYCLSKEFTTESFPFDSKTLVFKVGGRIFAATNIEQFVFITLKCEPETAIELRERYSGIKPGWHSNKKHWNSVYLNTDISSQLLQTLIDQSYELVYQTLTKKVRYELQNG